MKKWIGLATLLAIAQLRGGVIVEAIDTSTPNSMDLNPAGTSTRLAAVVTWTLPETYTNVVISAYLFGSDSFVGFLTNQIGPGTTSANLITPTVTGTGQANAFPFPGPPTVLFSGLTLDAGTYYLTILGEDNSPSGGIFWESKAGLSPTYGPGVTGGPFYLASNVSGQFGVLDLTFAPASAFADTPLGGSVYYSVTGDAPEPGTVAGVGLGLAFLVWMRRRSDGRA